MGGGGSSVARTGFIKDTHPIVQELLCQADIIDMRPGASSAGFLFLPLR